MFGAGRFQNTNGRWVALTTWEDEASLNVAFDAEERRVAADRSARADGERIHSAVQSSQTYEVAGVGAGHEAQQ